MGIFDIFIGGSQQAGVFSLYLPFILTFALIYGLLRKTEILGKGRPANALNAIIGFSVAFYVIAFTNAGVTIATFFNSFLTQTTALLVTVISMVLVLFAMQPLWPANEKLGLMHYLSIGKFVPLIVIAIFLWSFSSSGGATIFGVSVPNVFGGAFGLSSQDVVILAFIIVTVGILYFVTSEPKAEVQPRAAGGGGGGKGGEHGGS